MTKMKLAIVALLATFGLLAVPMVVSAQVEPNPALCVGVNLTEGETGNPDCGTADEAKNSITNIIFTVIDVFSLVVGAVSVIMIIIGGLRYITSAGDPGNVASAKNTILYAVVGLVIVIFAQTIVKYVISVISETN